MNIQIQDIYIFSILLFIFLCNTTCKVDIPPAPLSRGHFNREELSQLLNLSAGVFNNPIDQIGLEKIVVITGCNHGYLNHLHNFDCFAKRIDLKYLVIAMDRHAYEYIKENTTTLLTYHMTDGVVGEITSDSTDFRSKQFNLITAKKKEAVHRVLTLGYDVLFVDTDVAILRNPMPYLLWNNVDYVHSLNAVCVKQETWDFKRSKEEGNTGFYFVRSNNRTIKLWEHAYEVALKTPKLDDQAVFWHVIRRSSDPVIEPIGKCRHHNITSSNINSSSEIDAAVPLVTCFLDTCVFSSGMLSKIYIPEYTYGELLDNLKYKNESIVALHANYLTGNKAKMVRMNEHGFWLATPDFDAVHAYSTSTGSVNSTVHKHHHNVHVHTRVHAVQENETAGTVLVMPMPTQESNNVEININDLDLVHTHWAGGRCKEYSFIDHA